MHVVHQEHAAAQAGEHLLHPVAVERLPRLGGCPLEPLDDARLVPLGLQPAEEPRAGVRQRLVVEVHRVLRGDDDAEAEGAPLLQQRQQRRLRRRVRHGRQVAEDLVHVEERAQAGGAPLRPHPSHHLVQQQRDEEHPLGVGQVRDRQDRDARLAVGRVEQALHVERLAGGPGLEAGRGEQVVHRHGQLEAILRRVERLEVEHAHAGDRRGLDALDEVGQAEVFAVLPRRAHQRREQDVLAAAHRVGLDPEQPEQAGDGGREALADQLGVGGRLAAGRLERLQDREREAGLAARRVDGEVGRLAQAGDPLAVLPPLGQPLRPQRRLLGRVLLDRHPLAPRLVGVHPGQEVVGPQAREGEQQVAEVALRVDHDRGHAVDGGLLEQAEAQAGLPAAGHPHAHRVGHQVARVVEQPPVAALPRGQVVRLAQVEGAKLLEGLHSGKFTRGLGQGPAGRPEP